MTLQLYHLEQFHAANYELLSATDNSKAEYALWRRNAAADAIMFDREMPIEHRLAVALIHCEDLCHESTLIVMRKILAA